jgi:hypothetical protein
MYSANIPLEKNKTQLTLVATAINQHPDSQSVAIVTFSCGRQAMVSINHFRGIDPIFLNDDNTLVTGWVITNDWLLPPAREPKNTSLENKHEGSQSFDLNECLSPLDRLIRHTPSTAFTEEEKGVAIDVSLLASQDSLLISNAVITKDLSSNKMSPVSVQTKQSTKSRINSNNESFITIIFTIFLIFILLLIGGALGGAFKNNLGKGIELGLEWAFGFLGFVILLVILLVAFSFSRKD